MLGRKAQLPFSSQGSQEELKKSRGSDIYSHLLSFSPPHKPGTNTENQNRLIQRQTAHRLLLTSSSQNKTTVKEKSLMKCKQNNSDCQIEPACSAAPSSVPLGRKSSFSYLRNNSLTRVNLI